MKTEELEEVQSGQEAVPAPVPDKQQLQVKAILDGIAARELGENAPVFKQVSDDKIVSLIPDEANLVAWPIITVGRSGGIDLPQVRSWDATKKPLDVAIYGETFLAAQMARDKKRSDAAKEAAEKAAKKTAGTAEAPEGQPEPEESVA